MNSRPRAAAKAMKAGDSSSSTCESLKKVNWRSVGQLGYQESLFCSKFKKILQIIEKHVNIDWFKM